MKLKITGGPTAFDVRIEPLRERRSFLEWWEEWKKTEGYKKHPEWVDMTYEVAKRVWEEASGTAPAPYDEKSCAIDLPFSRAEITIAPDSMVTAELVLEPRFLDLACQGKIAAGQRIQLRRLFMPEEDVLADAVVAAVEGASIEALPGEATKEGVREAVIGAFRASMEGFGRRGW